MNKLTLLTAAAISSLTLQAVQASQFSYLYKDQRIMSMGGANVASGGYSSSIFSNPAGIAKVSNEHGMVVELLGLQAGGSDGAQDVVSDLNDAIESENEDEILAVLEDYSGQLTHFDLSNYSSITNNHGNFAWSLGLLSAADINLTPHANSVNGNGLLDVQARAYGGLTSAFSVDFKPFQSGRLSVGLGLKFIAQESYEGALTPEDLVDFDNIADNLEDKLQDDGSAFSGDLGFIYQFDETYMKPSIGLSVLNIGELNFDDSYGSQPMTVNVGVSIEPELIFAKKTIVALDYVDLFNENKNRYYDTGDGESTVYTETEDTDVVKRIRFGVSSLIYDNSWSSLSLAAGLYQGTYTAGFNFTASIWQIGFSTYEEQLGPQYGDDSDRRYNLSTGFMW